MVNTEEVNTEEVNAEEEAKTEKKLTKAVQLYDDEKLLEAGRILENIDDRTSFERKHLTIVEKAHKAQALVDELKTDLDTNDKSSEWIIHGVSKGEFPTLTAHKLQKTSDGTHIELKARCETPIDKSLLSPIISVLNETELYETWLPSWTVPRFKVKKCQKICQRGRCSQVIIITFDVPWPIASREIVLLGDGFDDIDSNGHIGIRLHSLNTGNDIEDGNDTLVPPPDNKNTVRIDVDGGFLFRQCPKDHPALLANENEEEGKEDKLLVTFAASMNPKMKLLPQSFLNFLVKVAFGICWSVLLKIARDVSNGKRQDHKNKIEEKRSSLYDWLETRVKAMFLFRSFA